MPESKPENKSENKSETKPRIESETKGLQLQFDDNHILGLVCGQHNENLARIEQSLGVSLDSFGNQISIVGDAETAGLASDILKSLYKNLANNKNLAGDKKLTSESDADADAVLHLVEDMLRLAENGKNPVDMGGQGKLVAVTWHKKIYARTPGQAQYFDLMEKNEVVFGLGPAGTGKTYMAVAKAVDAFKKKTVEKLILSRPAVEAGERLGFLPGDMKEKVDPYLRPLYDALYDMMPAQKVESLIASGEIEIAPLAFMRGRTLSNAFVLIDEAQNTTPVQMKMVLTRLGSGSRMVINGDMSQVDLPTNQTSGLADAAARLLGVKGIGIMRLSGADVVRHPIVARILAAYDSDQ